MGLERNRGAGKTGGGGGARVSANTEAPFSLFNDPPPIASLSSTHVNNSTSEIQALKEAMAQQTAILAAFMKERKDF